MDLKFWLWRPGYRNRIPEWIKRRRDTPAGKDHSCCRYL